MSESGDRTAPIAAGALDDRVVRTLAEHPGHHAFSGLRRALAAHPESLTRSLRRLERDGLIARDQNGYFLKERIEGAHVLGRSVRSIPLASVRLPFPIPPESVLGVLAGRWFGPLRWVGIYDARRPPALVWSVPGVPGQLVLQVRGGQLRLAAEGEGLRAAGVELTRASEELLWNVLGRLRALAPLESEGADIAPAGTVGISASTPASPGPRWAS